MNKNRFNKISKSNIGSMDKKCVLDNTALSDIYNAIQEIKYGSVQIHIQDGRVIQVDKIDKIRMR